MQMASFAMVVTSTVPLQSLTTEKIFFSGYSSVPRSEPKVVRKKRGVFVASARWENSGNPGSRLPSVAGVAASSISMLLSNVGAAQAITKEDVDDAYTKVELFTTQVTTAAVSTFEAAKSFYSMVFTTVKPGLDVAVPYVQQTTEAITKLAGPVASDLAEEAQKALRGAGVDTQSGLDFATSAAEQTSKILEGAQPLSSSVIESASTAGPLFLVEVGGGVTLFYLFAPSFISFLVDRSRGYAGDFTAAQALDILLKQDYTLIDVRTEKEKEKSGVPSLPNSSKNKYFAIPLEEFPGRIKSQLRNSSRVEAEVVAIKIASLKRLNKGSKIVIIDESGDVSRVVARALTSAGFANSYVIVDGFKGGRGWIQSRLGTDNYSSLGVTFAEVLSPSRIVPAGTRRLGTSSGSRTTRFNLLSGGSEE